jgi:ADP-heptose:LPS heptosyltransferase
MELIRKCLGCGSEISLFPDGKNIDLSCQKCGYGKGEFQTITKDKMKVTFQCPVCRSFFAVETNTETPLYHDAPNCKSRVVGYFGKYEGNEFLELKEPDDILKNIILIKRNRGLGDVLMVTSILPELKKIYPDKYIWFEADHDVADILKNNPSIDRILHTGSTSAFKNKFHKIINLLNAVENYITDGGLNKENRIERFWRLSDVPIKETSILRPRYYPTDDEISWAKEFLKIKPKDKAKFIMVAPESYASFRTLPPDKFKTYIDRAISTDLNLHFITVGEKPNLIFGRNIINLNGKLSLRMLGSLMTQCELVVCGDTGVYHLAEGLNIPSLVMFGSIPPEARISTYGYAVPLYHPESKECIPCWDKQREHGVAGCGYCMEAITIKELIDKTFEILKFRDVAKKYKSKAYA